VVETLLGTGAMVSGLLDDDVEAGFVGPEPSEHPAGSSPRTATLSATTSQCGRVLGVRSAAMC
jgi:hypothetical protein